MPRPLALEEALAYMHELGFAHRDIKPENIMYHGADQDKARVRPEAGMGCGGGYHLLLVLYRNARFNHLSHRRPTFSIAPFRFHRFAYR